MTAKNDGVAPGLGAWIFDLSEDPSERRNVATENPAVVQGLQAKIAAYNMSHVWLRGSG